VTTPTASTRLPAPWVLYALTLVSAAPLGALVAWQTPQPPGACSGIGWGCSLYEWDAAGLMLLFFGAPYAVVLGAVLAALAFFNASGALRRTVASVGFVIPWGFVALLLFR
jgi:hypothetical protein